MVVGVGFRGGGYYDKLKFLINYGLTLSSDYVMIINVYVQFCKAINFHLHDCCN